MQQRQPLEYLTEKLKPEKKQGADFFAEYRRYMTNIARTKKENTLKRYQGVYNNLETWQQETKEPITFDALTADNLQKWVCWLMESEGNNNPTVHKKVSTLKTMLDWAVDQGLTENTAYKGFTVSSKWETSHPALTEDELWHLHRLDLTNNPRLEKIRDVFCLGVFTGLRYSDLVQLKPEHRQTLTIKGQQLPVLKLVLIKTDEPLTVALPPPALEIVERYGLPLPVPSNQKYNQFLKELGKAAGLTRPVQKVQYQGAKRTESTSPLYEHLTTHTARRTFATVLIHRGVSMDVVQRAMAHHDQQQTTEYVKPDNIESIAKLANAWS